jgi:hypothetical protein
MKGPFQVATKVEESGSSLLSIAVLITLAKPGTSRLFPIIAVKRRPADVKGVPSYHAAAARIFQVVSIRPSGSTFQSPFSRLGTASASCGAQDSLLVEVRHAGVQHLFDPIGT